MIIQATGFLMGTLLLAMSDVSYQVTLYSLSLLSRKEIDVTSI